MKGTKVLTPGAGEIFFLGAVEQLYRMRFYLSVPRNHKLRRMRYKFNL